MLKACSDYEFFHNFMTDQRLVNPLSRYFMLFSENNLISGFSVSKWLTQNTILIFQRLHNLFNMVDHCLLALFKKKGKSQVLSHILSQFNIFLHHIQFTRTKGLLVLSIQDSLIVLRRNQDMVLTLNFKQRIFEYWINQYAMDFDSACLWISICNVALCPFF